MLTKKEVLGFALVIALLLGGGCLIGLSLKPSKQVQVPVPVTPAPHVSPAVFFYPSWSNPGDPVPPALQGSVPHVNGATQFTVVDCSQFQCTGYSGAGPDMSSCGSVTNNEQVCVK